MGFTNVATDRAAFKVSLEAVSLETPLGPFRFTADHDVYQPVWIVAMNGKGGYRLVTEVPPTQTQSTTSTQSPASTTSTTNGAP